MAGKSIYHEEESYLTFLCIYLILFFVNNNPLCSACVSVSNLCSPQHIHICISENINLLTLIENNVM